MKTYKTPVMDILMLKAQEVIATSGCGDDCMDDYDCDVEGPAFCIMGDD